jgi:hypothetical protein
VSEFLKQAHNHEISGIRERGFLQEATEETEKHFYTDFTDWRGFFTEENEGNEDAAGWRSEQFSQRNDFRRPLGGWGLTA